MPVETFELWTLSAIILLLLGLYIWLRLSQRRKQRERERKLRCKELILDKRLPLAAAGVDFDRLVSLVKMNISPGQLETVIELLTAHRVIYSIDDPEDPECVKVELDFDKKEESLKVEQKTAEGEAEAVPAVFEKLNPEQEKAWLRMARNRFRKALTDKEISEKQAKFRLLVKMVELGKKAVESDRDKSVARKSYEISLWDRFYEDEYLELNAE